MFGPDEIPDVGLTAGAVTAIGDDGRAYLASRDGLFIAGVDGGWSLFPGWYSKVQLSPSGEFLVAEVGAVIENNRMVEPLRIAVLDLDGNVVADLGEGAYPAWPSLSAEG